MGKLLLLEFRKNVKSAFLYLAFLAALAYQLVGLLGEEYAALPGRYTIPVIGANLFTTQLLLNAILLYLVVKDFEVGIIKEYLFVGYARKEIFVAKYLCLCIESSVATFLAGGGTLLWKTIENGYGIKITEKEVWFLLKILVGNTVACVLLCAIGMLCVILINNALALGAYFLLVSALDMTALFLIARFEIPQWISIRYLVSCFYNSVLTIKEYATALAVMLAGGCAFLMLGLAIFRRKEYR